LLALAKIMIVDDDSAVQSAIRLVLEPAGHTIFVAGDGRKGLSIFEAENVDLVLLDIFMPGMDGLETMRLIQQRRPLIPIIVISGRPIASDAASGPDFLAMATRLGAAASLRKPFKRAALLAAIADCIEAAKRPQSSSLQADDTASASDAKNKSPVRPSLRPGANPAPSEK
jgi:CheY-like chemotaxis protein